MSKRVYGVWTGNPKGISEDETKCIKEVWPRGRADGWFPWQCQRKRGYGFEGLYCKQHARMIEERWDEERSANDE